MRRATRFETTMPDRMEFQSTLSMRRATACTSSAPTNRRISIHALHEESDSYAPQTYRLIPISIHALHEESDLSGSVHTVTPDSFQSTLSMRRATIISPKTKTRTLFQSTLSMRRATPASIMLAAVDGSFQSTLSMRRATR